MQMQINIMLDDLSQVRGCFRQLEACFVNAHVENDSRDGILVGRQGKIRNPTIDNRLGVSIATAL